MKFRPNAEVVRVVGSQSRGRGIEPVVGTVKDKWGKRLCDCHCNALMNDITQMKYNNLFYCLNSHV